MVKTERVCGTPVHHQTQDPSVSSVRPKWSNKSIVYVQRSRVSRVVMNEPSYPSQVKVVCKEALSLVSTQLCDVELIEAKIRSKSGRCSGNTSSKSYEVCQFLQRHSLLSFLYLGVRKSAKGALPRSLEPINRIIFPRWCVPGFKGVHKRRFNLSASKKRRLVSAPSVTSRSGDVDGGAKCALSLRRHYLKTSISILWMM